MSYSMKKQSQEDLYTNLQNSAYKQQQQLQQSPYHNKHSSSGYLSRINHGSSVLLKEQDPFNYQKIDDLFQGYSEWTNIQDIIRQSFRALTETVKQQGETIIQLDKQLQQKITRNELQHELVQKANSQDIIKNIADIQQTLDQKVSYEECRVLIKEDIQMQNQEFQLDILNRLDEREGYNQKKIYSEFTNLSQQIQQKPSMNELHEILENKANKSWINSLLSKKADKQYVDNKLSGKADNNQINQIMNIIEQKADQSQVQKVLNVIDSKGDKQEIELQNINLKSIKDDLNLRFQEVQNKYIQTLQDLENQKYDLSNKADNQQLEKLINQQNQHLQMQNQMENIRNELQNQIEQIQNEQQRQEQNLEETVIKKDEENDKLYGILREDIIKINEILRNQSEDIRKDLESNVQLVRNIASSVKNDIIRETQILADNLSDMKQEIAENSIDKQDYFDFRKQIDEQLQKKMDIEEIQSAQDTQQKNTEIKVNEIKKQFDSNIKDFEQQILKLLNQKVTVQDLHELLKQKADQKVIESNLMQKASINDVQNLANQLEKIVDQVQTKLNNQEFQSNIKQILDDLTEVKQQIQNKADFQQTFEAIQQKSDVQDVRSLMNNLQQDIDKRALIETINIMNRDQAIINESLCTQNIVGRWMWKSGQISSGGQIPWEIQNVNTLPDNYIWEKDRAHIVVCSGGLYEVLVGFYSLRKPTIQILVNGEPVLSAVSRSEQNSRVKEHKHSLGQLIGLNLREVLILPQRSRVSIIYNGDKKGEGFLSLKRI